jgi:hypothetical protein
MLGKVYVLGDASVARVALLKLCPDRIWLSRLSVVYELNGVAYSGDVATDNVWANGFTNSWEHRDRWFIGFFDDTELSVLDSIKYEVEYEIEGSA